MNGFILALLIASQSNAICSSLQNSSVDDYRHCILSVQVDRLQSYHDAEVGPTLSNLATRVTVLESWQFYIKLILGIGGGGGVVAGRKKGMQLARKITGTGDGRS